MQVTREPTRRSTVAGVPTRQPTLMRGRSSTLQRVGASVSTDTPSTPPNNLALNATASAASVSAAGPAADGGPEELSPVAASLSNEDVSMGLTPASLKHLRRQKERLTEENAKLQAELEAARAQLKEQRAKAERAEQEAREATEREAALRVEVQQATEREQEQRTRADELERRLARLEESLAAKEAEAARLKDALEEQRKLTKEVCEAAECQASGSSANTSELEDRIKTLTGENRALKEEMKRMMEEYEAMKLGVAQAMTAAERAMKMHAIQRKALEELHAAKLSDAINEKVELHISVPRVTLTYNNAPPLMVSAAVGLGEDRIRAFLHREVFPAFEPLWVRMDNLDRAPDGSSKRTYATKMLDQLTDAVKGFVLKSQQADAGATLGTETPIESGPAARSGSGVGGSGGCSSDGGGSGGPSKGGGSSSLAAVKAAAAKGEAQRASRSSGRAATVGGATGGAAGAPGGPKSMAEADRLRLLELLRSGDDQGLDAKLCQMLQQEGQEH